MKKKKKAPKPPKPSPLDSGNWISESTIADAPARKRTQAADGSGSPGGPSLTLVTDPLAVCCSDSAITVTATAYDPTDPNPVIKLFWPGGEIEQASPVTITYTIQAADIGTILSFSASAVGLTAEGKVPAFKAVFSLLAWTPTVLSPESYGLHLSDTHPALNPPPRFSPNYLTVPKIPLGAVQDDLFRATIRARITIQPDEATLGTDWWDRVKTIADGCCKEWKLSIGQCILPPAERWFRHEGWLLEQIFDPTPPVIDGIGEQGDNAPPPHFLRVGDIQESMDRYAGHRESNGLPNERGRPAKNRPIEKSKTVFCIPCLGFR